MAYILNIETATTMCSVAIAEGDNIVAHRELNQGYTHAENLSLFIEEVLKEAALNINKMDAIAVSCGPGSYTGLRIGVSTAKGICYALEKPLIAVNTLEVMLQAVMEKDKKQLYCPMIDARRMEVYCSLFDNQGKVVQRTEAIIIDGNSFSTVLKNNEIVFFGDGAAKCQELLSANNNAIFIKDIFPTASLMASLSAQAFEQKRFENVAYFEPHYLKDFVLTTPK